MKQAFKKICLICTVLVFIPLISSLPLQIDQKQLQKSNAQNTTEYKKTNEEIFNPSNWIARGGCWDFSKKIITGQGMGSRPIAYFKKEIIHILNSRKAFSKKPQIVKKKNGRNGL